MNISGFWTYDNGNGWTSFKKNLIVASGNLVLASALKDPDHTLYHAIGSGSITWTNAIPNPAKDSTSLLNEYYRRPVNSISHITEITGFHTVNSPNPANEIESSAFGPISSSLLIGRPLEIIAGTNIGDTRNIIGKSGNVVTLSTNLTTNPTSSTKWRVGYVSNTATGILDFQTIFGAKDINAEGTIREEGLFGSEATAELNTGTLFAIIHHEPIVKVSGTALSRIVRIRLQYN